MNSPKKTSLASAFTVRNVLRFLSFSVLMLAILFIAAGRIDWWEAWAYVGVTLTAIILSRVLMFHKNPELASERATAEKQQNVKRWDTFLVPLVALYGPLASMIVAGLDVRWGWTGIKPALWVQLVALGLIVLGNAFSTWALVVNAFFSSYVRIQKERGHQVVDSGPYRIMRHPGYAGGVLTWLALPFYFGSVWVVIPAALTLVALIVRTALEDRTLQEELPGYVEYAQRTRFRLLPGVW